MVKEKCDGLPFVQYKLAVALCFFILLGLMGCNDKQPKKTNVAANDSVQQLKNVVMLDDSDSKNVNKRITPDTNWLLQPGVAAGKTKINEDADSVYARLGKPDGGDAAMMKAVAIWFAHHDTTSHSIAIYTARNTDSGAVARVLQIRVTSPFFKMKDGIHTTSFLSDIQKQFDVKKTEDYVDENRNYEVYDSPQGIAFEINGQNKKCVAIVVHEAGKIGEGAYLKFRTTNKYLDKAF